MYQQQASAVNANLSAEGAMADIKPMSMFNALSRQSLAAFAAANFPCPTSASSTNQFPGTSSSGSIPHNQLGPSKRERTKYTEFQLNYLENMFRESKYPDGQLREHISKVLELTEVKVQVWFKNRRAKMRNEEKFEKMRRDAAKVSQMKGSASVKREESVEDTEEEDQQGKAKQNVGKGHAKGKNAGKSAAKQNTSSTAPKIQPDTSSLLLPYELQKGLAQMEPSLYSSHWTGQLGPVSSSNGTAEMGSLMQMAAAFPAHSQSFYSGWPQTAAAMGYAPIFSSPYGSSPAGQMFGQLPNGTHYYNPQTAANYYFGAGQTEQNGIE